MEKHRRNNPEMFRPHLGLDCDEVFESREYDMSIRRALAGAILLLGIGGNSAHALTCGGTPPNTNIGWNVLFDASSNICTVTDANNAIDPSWLSFQAAPVYEADAYFALWGQGEPAGSFTVNGNAQTDGSYFSYFQGNIQGLVTATIIGNLLGVAYEMIVSMRADGGSNIYLISASVSPINAVPVPATLPLLASGLGALGVIGWRRKRKQVQA